MWKFRFVQYQFDAFVDVDVDDYYNNDDIITLKQCAKKNIQDINIIRGKLNG